MNVITKTVALPDGRTISIETGKLAKQADGAVMLRLNNTMLLATVVAAKDAVPGTDFMPLQCDYKEKYSAAGRFPGGFIPTTITVYLFTICLTSISVRRTNGIPCCMKRPTSSARPTIIVMIQAKKIPAVTICARATTKNRD